MTVAMLAADNARARAYADLLRRAGLAPVEAVVLAGPGAVRRAAEPVPTPRFDNVTPLSRTLRDAGTAVRELDTHDLGDARVVQAVAALQPEYIVFAAPPGAIVRAPLFATGKRFLHVHPGRVPDYRGSTPMYYSLLAEGRLEATAMLLAPEIDTGPILEKREFPVPADPREIDTGYDPWMRATLMTDVVARLARDGHLDGSPQATGGTTYFIIHPVLKHLAVLGRHSS